MKLLLPTASGWIIIIITNGIDQNSLNKLEMLLNNDKS